MMIIKTEMKKNGLKNTRNGEKISKSKIEMISSLNNQLNMQNDITKNKDLEI